MWSGSTIIKQQPRKAQILTIYTSAYRHMQHICISTLSGTNHTHIIVVLVLYGCGVTLALSNAKLVQYICLRRKHCNRRNGRRYMAGDVMS